MYFVAVLYSIFSTIFSTAPSPKYMSFTRSKYGDVILLTIRKTEKLSTKVQKAKCDLEFLRLCLIYQLTPKFVKIKLWKKRIKCTTEYTEFQQFCLKEEYKSRHKDVVKYEKELSTLIKILKSKLNKTDFTQLQRHLYNKAKTLKEQTTRIHHDKISKLNRGSVGQNYLCMKSKIVQNFSSYKLSEAEERLLCRGWEFCIENRITNFCELKTDIELNTSQLEQYCHPSIFRKVCGRIQNFSEILIKSIKNKKIRNMSDEEFSALKSLKNNKNIVICKADKGNAIVVLDKIDYITKAQEILKLNQFKLLKTSPLKEKEASMNKYLHKLYKENVIDQKLFWRLHSTSSSIAAMYGQPKIHKLSYPLRPIISSVNTYNYELSKYLTKIIKDNRPSKSFSFIRDSFEFVKRIRTLENSNNHTMVSFDVDNLYTNVPVNEAIEITLDTLYKRDNPPPILFNRTQLKTLLQMSVCHIPFRFLDKVYIQTDGVAMGSPLGPILADLFMSKLETKLNRFSKNRPILWLRYVDDIFCVF